MQWQLGREMGTIPTFASRTQENQETLGRGGRSQDLPDSGFQPAVQHLSQVVRLSNDKHSTNTDTVQTQIHYKHRYSTNTDTVQTQIHSTDKDAYNTQNSNESKYIMTCT